MTDNNNNKNIIEKIVITILTILLIIAQVFFGIKQEDLNLKIDNLTQEVIEINESNKILIKSMKE